MKIQPITYFRNQININQSPNKISTQVVDNNKYVQTNEITNFFYFPISFSSKTRTHGADSSKRKLAEKSGNFAISKIGDITCPSCGKKMLNRATFNLIAQELANIPNDQYLEYLGHYREYMRPVEESVYDEILALSEKNGNSKDIRTMLVDLRDTKLPILQKTQMRQIKKMRAIAKGLPQNEKNALMKKLDSLQCMIRKKNPSAPVRRKIMIDRISKIKIQNPKKYEKIQTLAKGFPTSSDMNSAWIVKYSGKNKQNEDWTSYQIALRFLESSIANTDHIIAYDLNNNGNDISNYISMHQSCNSQKGNKPFLQWLNEDKENRIKYMKKYFDEVNSLIGSEKLKKKKYKDYVAYATQTIFEASKGELKLFEDDNPKLSN